MQTPLIDIHTHNHSSPGVISLFSCLLGRDAIPPQGLYSVGLHPWQVGDEEPVCDAAFASLFAPALTPRLVAIGEIGLDFSTAHTPVERARQERYFTRQLTFASMHRLPVIIHCVKAYNELITTLRPHSTPVLIHGFTGSIELATRLLAMGCYLSFGESLLHSPKTQASLRATPLGRLFLETDQSTCSLTELYTTAACLRSCSTASLTEALYNNFKTLYHDRMAGA